MIVDAERHQKALTDIAAVAWSMKEEGKIDPQAFEALCKIYVELNGADVNQCEIIPDAPQIDGQIL
jgi:hypothetical protein